MKAKVVVLLIGGMVALLLLLHYLSLSRSGMPYGWMLYLGLPVTAVGVLFALRLIHLGDGWVTAIDNPERTRGVRGRPSPAMPVSVMFSPTVCQRLQDLEALRGSGEISDTEYAARRLQIIAER